LLRRQQRHRRSVSILALKAALLVPAAKLASEWGTWWIGDLFGLLVWTPIVLTLIGSPRSEWAPRRLSSA
jgi:integral membrane sensor domain MASE1